jgi:hypothetical protein
VLEKYDCIELVDTKQRRGATEHFYRATRRQFLTDSEWARMPESLRPGLAGAMLKSVFEDLEDASNSGTLDEVEDLHLSRTPMVVDKQGWADVSSLLKGTLDRVLEIQTEASERIAAGEEPGILSKVHMLHFKSPTAEAAAKAQAEADPEAAAAE